METSAANQTAPLRIEPYSGPAWNNSIEYPSLRSNEFVLDREAVDSLLSRLRELIDAIKPIMSQVLQQPTLEPDFYDRTSLVTQLQAISELQDQALVLLQNLGTYASCEMSTDATNTEALKLLTEVKQQIAKLEAVTKPAEIFLNRAPETIVEAYLAHPHTKPEAFALRQSRLMSDTLLSEPEETLLATLTPHGLDAWHRLYDQISGTLRCRLEKDDKTTETVGLAQAEGMLRDASEPVRRSAWHAIQEAWKSQEVPTASILNGLAGWRLEVYEKRSHTRKLHFLDMPLHLNRIKRETLEAMWSAVRDEVETPRRALRAMARGLNKNQLDPWDLLAAPPETGHASRRPFKEALSLIHDAFANVDSTFGDFVDTMAKNRWIEGRVLPTKRQGAYCTRFVKSRAPRVFQTYMGSISDIRTLAHELGHAYHSWVMRDLPRVLHQYPMTLAETASIFAETAFTHHVSQHGDAHARFEIAWQNASTAAALLLNIPSRFDFETAFYEKRTKSLVSAQELGDLMETAWKKWYGDTLSMPERQFWMTKQHFSMAWTSFYNFPYTFGYLFSLGIYSRRVQQGATFMPSYIALLRDAGQMTAEELVQKHLGEDITQPDFWKKSIAIVADQVQVLEGLLSAQEPERLHH